MWRRHQGTQCIERCGGSASIACESEPLAELRGCTEELTAPEANLDIRKRYTETMKALYNNCRW